MQLAFALKTSGGELYRDLFIKQSQKSPKFDQCEVERKWDEVQVTNGRAPVTTLPSSTAPRWTMRGTWCGRWPR